MVMPVLAALGITQAVWIAVLGAIKLISWILGIGYVSAKVIDLGTNIVEGQEQASQDATIEAILARNDITSAQKIALILAYLESLADKAKPTGYVTYALYAVGILAAAYVIGQFIGGKK